MNKPVKNSSVYLVSLCEGAAVMSTELCGSKILSPFYGSSLYVWASVIAVTLGSLAGGYFFGGRLSEKGNQSNKLVLILLIAAVYMGCMPLISNFFPLLAVIFPLLSAVVISSVAILLVPMLLMGAASPLIIAIIADNKKDPGRVSGTVYAVSTVGGIISTFLCGFWLIPDYGINITILLFALVLAVSLLLFVPKKSKATVGIIIIALITLSFGSKPSTKNCIFQKDGLLGKLNVIDDTIKSEKGIEIIRKLLVNNVVQSELELKSNKPVSGYISILDSNIAELKSGKALVLGLGGGLTANVFVKKGYEVEGVDMDQRIIDVAKNYFYLNKNVKTIQDDARHFVAKADATYDLILVDLFKAEEQPVHTVTKECFLLMKEKLKKGGAIILNWHGYLKGQMGLGTCILLNTLKASGLTYKICALTKEEDQRNLVIFASLEEPSIKYFEIFEAITATKLINTDNRPLLEKYNASANQTWRENYIHYYYSGN